MDMLIFKCFPAIYMHLHSSSCLYGILQIPRCWFYIHVSNVNRASSVATGWNIQVRFWARAGIFLFPTNPGRFWGLPSLVFSGSVWGVKLTAHPNRVKYVALCSYQPFHCIACTGICFVPWAFFKSDKSSVWSKYNVWYVIGWYEPKLNLI